jgi:hypothetical protein
VNGADGMIDILSIKNPFDFQLMRIGNAKVFFDRIETAGDRIM